MIPDLSVSELGLLTSVVYFFLTAIAYSLPDIPEIVERAFMVATIFLFFISYNPILSFVVDESSAKEIGFIFAIVVGIASLAAAWYHFHLDRETPQNE